VVRVRKSIGPILAICVLGLVSVVALAACGSSSGVSSGAAHGKFTVVAAENFWGSIAAQLAGADATVKSIIVNPDTDPHSYDPTSGDARALATANMVIVNGIGYDQWAPKLLAANPVNHRIVFTVGHLLGLKEGDNPHQWYSPTGVYRVVGQIVADYDRLDPAHASYFAQRQRAFETHGLARYNQLRQQIRARYAGVPVGYSESIFRPLAEDLHLTLSTPYSFAKAIAEGTDVTADDKRDVDQQAQSRAIKVWVFNRQNVTPDVQRVNQIAQAHKIPIATVTETLSPASDTFEQWQVTQLEGLARALHEATGR
jgi:zinc/manganese transport system substrate-binding protein